MTFIRTNTKLPRPLHRAIYTPGRHYSVTQLHVFPQHTSPNSCWKHFSVMARLSYSYVDEQALHQRFQKFYTHSTTPTADDAAWLSIFLLIFAIGTQFAHLKSTPQREAENQTLDNEYYAQDDQIALSFYRAACKLIPDVLIIASTESVQAFLLFGVFSRRSPSTLKH